MQSSSPARWRISRSFRGTCGPVVRQLCLAVVLGAASPQAASSQTVELDTSGYDPECGVAVTQHGPLISVSWNIGASRSARWTLDLDERNPLVDAVQLSQDAGASWHPLTREVDPLLVIRIGQRDLAKRNGWTIFFDRMQEKPSEVVRAVIGRSRVAVSSRAQRATLTLGDITAGPFQGELRCTFFAGNAFVLVEAVVTTRRNGVAFLYDMGLVFPETVPDQLTWRDAEGTLQQRDAREIAAAQSLAVRHRSVAASFDRGTLALFPPPHRFFYPLDFSDNLRNIWAGPDYAPPSSPWGLGIRHEPAGDNRFVPWFNAPPHTRQALGMFVLMSDASAEGTLAEVARLTRDDRFKPLAGHTVFSSHYHVEHTREVLLAQQDAEQQRTDGPTVLGHMPTGESYQIPHRLQKPGFVRVFRQLGVDIVHLAEFHFGQTPRMDASERLQHLQLLHAECARLSDESFLLLPGEEPNVHLGGHWISFFPRPVYWVLNRPQGTPFVTEHPQLGKVYHVGSAADVLRLLNAEQGLAWTAHPRIKGSTGFPDRYRQELFFESDRFLGAAWKAMPADLSQPQLGSRVLDLLNDMSNWSIPKYVLGEVDVFKIEPDHELYGHMNVNYLRLDRIPRFAEGWQAVLHALRRGQFFVTTGEVLIPKFAVAGKQSGESASITSTGSTHVQLSLQWTFPLDYLVLISGDGTSIRRKRIDLSQTIAFDESTFDLEVDLRGMRWVRAEVWDVATNGAFTQPVWLQTAHE